MNLSKLEKDNSEEILSSNKKKVAYDTCEMGYKPTVEPKVLRLPQHGSEDDVDALIGSTINSMGHNNLDFLEYFTSRHPTD